MHNACIRQMYGGAPYQHSAAIHVLGVHTETSVEENGRNAFLMPRCFVSSWLENTPYPLQEIQWLFCCVLSPHRTIPTNDKNECNTLTAFES